MYLPDTNVFILGLKGNKKEASFLAKAISKNKLFISVSVVAEFLAKAEGEGQESFLTLMGKFPVLDVDREVAQVAAQYRKQSLKTKKVFMLDCFLAAQAKLNYLTLVTNNKADFPMKDIRVIVP